MPSPNHGRSDRGGEMRQGLRGHMGELSQGFEGVPMAPGTHATLRALTNPERCCARERQCRSGSHAACRAIPVGHRLLLGEFEKNQERSCPRTISGPGHFGHHQTGSSHSTPEARRWHQGIVVGEVGG